MGDADDAAEAAQGALLHSSGLAQDFFAAMGGDKYAAERAGMCAASTSLKNILVLRLYVPFILFERSNGPPTVERFES